ncbi:hypothetical protein M977_01996 [Buttiauxella gaviniae ATCC 51604]|uniref:Uncharacterized protein n=1 Tax=Buttiauxella gaviniae ATCC 51604 TaxID=1354253 RepID=A0A1B7I0J2_9ENTR|nr:hypothetical protein M977_01996 [Buttiauxella gaviniae ATCC 51604]
MHVLAGGFEYGQSALFADDNARLRATEQFVDGGKLAV